MALPRRRRGNGESTMSDTSDPRVVSHQTVRLSHGCHAQPADGACVMELASMLAGEKFSDRPKSVCRVIASFLRAYNDALDVERRQDLYRCAAQVVGTRSSRATERARLARCERELADLRGGARPGPLRWIVHCTRVLDRSSHVTGFFDDLARALLRAGGPGHRRALALVDELAGLEVVPAPPCRVTSGRADLAVRAHQLMRT
jgi:hypothetical protein